MRINTKSKGWNQWNAFTPTFSREIKKGPGKRVRVFTLVNANSLQCNKTTVSFPQPCGKNYEAFIAYVTLKGMDCIHALWGVKRKSKVVRNKEIKNLPFQIYL